MRRYLAIGHVASMDDVGWYLGKIRNSEGTEQLDPDAWTWRAILRPPLPLQRLLRLLLPSPRLPRPHPST